MSDYPVGATWEGNEVDAVNLAGHFHNEHRRAMIWLDARRGGTEVWNWQWFYEDGSHGGYDWATSYRMCKNALPFYCRMKRVK